MSVWFAEAAQPAAQEAYAGADAATGLDLIRPPLDDIVAVGADALPEGGAGMIGHSAVETELTRPSAFADDPSSAAGEIDSPPLAPGRHSDMPQLEADKNIESLAAARSPRRARHARKSVSAPVLPVVICALLLLIACLIAARQQVVRALPQTASLYARIGLPVNLRNLTFDNIKTTREMQDGVPVLVVEGDIVTTSARLADVPRLRLAVLNAAGREIYAWTAQPSRSLLAPGETLQFRSRLASPPAEASGVTVRFFNRRDAQAGML